MNSLNVEEVVKHVKTLADINRCVGWYESMRLVNIKTLNGFFNLCKYFDFRILLYVFSDELKGIRVRYPCGHPICSECVQTADICLLCLSPPNDSNHVHDGPLSFRVEHASNLLNTFQELFKLDGTFSNTLFYSSR